MSRKKTETAAKSATNAENEPIQGAQEASVLPQEDASASLQEAVLEAGPEAEVQVLDTCRVAFCPALRLRETPGRDGKVIRELPAGTAVTVNCCSWRADGTGVWMPARVDGLEGWVDARYLTQAGEGAS